MLVRRRASILCRPQTLGHKVELQMMLREALEQIPGITWTGSPNVDICGISYDSRSVQKGHLFVAIKGENNDGADFVAQAVDRGAAAIASEGRPAKSPAVSVTVSDARKFLAEISRIYFGDPSAKLKLAGITGTKGKTTTSYLIDSICRHAGIPSCLAGTIMMKIGTRIMQSHHTTPESSDLMQFLQEAAVDGCTHGALEVSSHALAMKRVFGVRFTVGVFMNLTHDHLDFHKNMENYFQAKQLLFSAENGNQIKSAVINVDDAYGKRLASETSVPVMRFGFREPADIHTLEYQYMSGGADLSLDTPAGQAKFHLKLIGRPNAYNVMAATGAALCLGIDLKTIHAGIEALDGVPGRMEIVDAGQDFSVIVDYAHSPDSLDNLLQTASQLPHKRLITVFGCGGSRDKTKRPIMGEIAASASDYVIATSDNPRAEDPMQILKEIEPGIQKGPAPYGIEPDRRIAIDSAISMARTGDVVLIAGKGHEDYQIIGSQVIPFDDRKVARDLIQKRLKSEKRK
jgi:UDP-N-acetylmuramoyl-L-alanyl-D-glutamate--2,6-diaminopimelate ligase